MSASAADWTLTRAVDELASGRVTAEEYARALLDRCAEHRGLNAFISRDPARVLEQARAADSAGPSPARPLHGVPIAVKDNIDVAGWNTTAGTPALRGNLVRADSAVWSRLREAGAIPLGKTNMHELAYGITGDNRCYGPVGNPAAEGRLAGGSSSGSAAAVAASLAPAGLGTDTGGSVRIPAALCGVTGFRPSTGRYPTAGVLRISHTRDTVGVLARDVADLRLLDGVLAGEAGEQDVAASERPAPRLVVPSTPGVGDLDPELMTVVRRGVEELRSAGWELVESDFPPEVPELIDRTSFPVALAETPTNFRSYLSGTEEPLDLERLVASVADPEVRELLYPLPREVPIGRTEYRRALSQRLPELERLARRTLDRHDAVAYLVPTTVLGAPGRNVSSEVLLNGRSVPTFATYVRNTNLASLIGWPSVSIPAGRTERGLPVGFQLDARAGHDRELLDLARRCGALLSGGAVTGGEDPHIGTDVVRE
ncbi:amidase [Actinopolyspora erythraea]|uniref:Amidase n=1 Tax=Actinopolyspora erythraea TaxID=414996 RepID=A0A223RSI1_9ACTN|nr:amidase family protein [Actinopolyspora erythraea]ASU78833.1 amidase [Actinopolyspora erythraea]